MSEDIQIQEKSKTPTTCEVELFGTLANGCAPLVHGTWGLSKYHGGPRYTSELIFLKMSKADLKFLKTSNFVFHT